MERELRAIRAEVEETRTEWDKHRCDRASPASTSASGLRNIQVPTPATYQGTRKTTEVENFFFGLEQYNTSRPKVSTMTLQGSALHPHSFEMQPNFGGVGSMATRAKASAPSAHFRTSRENFGSTSLQAMPRRRQGVASAV